MSWQASRWARHIALNDAKLGHGARSVLGWLASDAHYETGIARAGRWLSLATGYHPGHVRKLADELVIAGHITKLPTAPGDANEYVFPVARIDEWLSTSPRTGARGTDVPPRTGARPPAHGCAVTPRTGARPPAHGCASLRERDVEKKTQPWCEPSCVCDGTGWEQEDPEDPNSRAKPCRHRSAAMWGTA